MACVTNCFNKAGECCIPLEIHQCFRQKNDLSSMLGQRQQLIQSLNGFDIGAIGSVGAIIGIVQKLIKLEKKIFGHGADATTPQPALQTEAAVTKWGARATAACAFALTILAYQTGGTSSTSSLGNSGSLTCVNGSITVFNITLPCETKTSSCTISGTENAYIVGAIVLLGATLFLHFLSDRSNKKIAKKDSSAAAFNALQTVGALKMLTPVDKQHFKSFSQVHKQIARQNFLQPNANVMDSQITAFTNAYRHAQTHFGSTIPHLTNEQIRDYWVSRVVQQQPPNGDQEDLEDNE